MKPSERLEEIKRSVDIADPDINWLINRINGLTEALELLQGILEGCYIKEAMIKTSDIAIIRKALERV